MAECSEGLWNLLPYTVLIDVFHYLDTYTDVVHAGQCCRLWNKASKNDTLWKKLFCSHFSVEKSVVKVPDTTWYAEFKRLVYHIPLILTETETFHDHQVLHVSFSHNGKYFATCSKDGNVVLWNSKYPASLRNKSDMKLFSWKYTQYSQFNKSDTLLLVSGVHFGTPHSTSGEIAVFNVADFTLQCRVVNKPYDIFGTWYSDQYLFSGNLHWLAHLVSSSILWLNKASQEADSELTPITHCLYRFYNRNASTIRAIMVADCLPNSENAQSEGSESSSTPPKPKEHGNPVSHRDIPDFCVEGSSAWTYGDIVPNYRKAEPKLRKTPSSEDSDEEMNWSDAKDEAQGERSSDTSSESESEHYVKTDKYLIFTTGCKTYTPHQVGFKRIKPFVFPERLDPGPSLKERLLLHEQKKEQLRSGSPPPDLDWLNYDLVADKFDKVDHLIDLHGHIVGMALSPDQRYLYVNSRSWPVGYKITNPLDPPPIAEQIDLHVIDLVTLKQVGTMMRAHQAYTPNNECFFIFLDVCNEYVASGAEDNNGYLWDRHYGLCLAKFPHDDVVNSVAFNPKDPEMLVTTSDDKLIKIWRSRAMVNKLKLSSSEMTRGLERCYMKKTRRRTVPFRQLKLVFYD